MMTHPAPLLAADPGQSTGWLIAAVVLLIRDYGWMMALAGFAGVWKLRGAKRPLMAFLMVILFVVSAFLLPVSIIFQFIPFVNTSKQRPPTEVRKAVPN
jgi:hypothetical protein